MAILPLDNITFSQAGSYTVVISNVTGITTSAPVTLTVVSNISNPILTAANQGSMDQLGVAGLEFPVKSKLQRDAVIEWVRKRKVVE